MRSRRTPGLPHTAPARELPAILVLVLVLTPARATAADDPAAGAPAAAATAAASAPAAPTPPSPPAADDTDGAPAVAPATDAPGAASAGAGAGDAAGTGGSTAASGVPGAGTPPRSRATVEARRRFARAEKLFERGRYSDAAREYERGYRLAPLPGFLINIAHCHVRRGHLHQAREIYLQFLDAAPSSPRRGEVERAIAAIDRAIDPLKALEVEDMPASPPALTSTSTVSSRISLAPPVLVTPPRSARDRERRLGLGGSTLRGLDMRKMTTPPGADASRRASDDKGGGWVWPVVGGVAAGLITGAMVILIGRGTNDDGIRSGSIGNLSR